MLIDLHTHSAVSDGTDRPADLIDRAVAAGLDVVALTDHDTFDGLAEAASTAAERGIEFLPGMEMSCVHSGPGRWGVSVHLLAYGMDVESPGLAEEMVRLRRGRDDRVPRLLSRLAELGMPLTEAEVVEQAAGSPSIGRPHIADAMVARGYVADRTEAFDRYLADNGPAHVDRYACPLEAGIELIHRAGGVAVIAHPWGRSSKAVLDADELGRLVREHGLDGFEIDHQDHGRRGSAERAELRRLATSLGVLGTGSSDYHGTGKTNHDLGCNTTDPEVYRRLLAALSR